MENLIKYGLFCKLIGAKKICVYIIDNNTIMLNTYYKTVKLIYNDKYIQIIDPLYEICLFKDGYNNDEWYCMILEEMNDVF